MKRRVWAAYALSLLGLAAYVYCQHQAAAYWDAKTAQGTDWAVAEQWLNRGTAALLFGWISGAAGSLMCPFKNWQERAALAAIYCCAYGLVWAVVGIL